MLLRNTGLAICSGILFGVGFLIPVLWPLALIGVVPLLFALHNVERTRYAFLYGWMASAVLSLIALVPIFWGTLPLDWYGFSSVLVQWIAVCISWMLTSATLALGGGMFALLHRWYATDSWRDIFVAPSAWVLSEWAGSYLFSGIAAGPGSLLGAHFTLTYIGYVLAEDGAFLQLAKLGDVYALSFAAIALGAIAYRMLRARQKKERRVLYICIVIICGVWFAAHAGLHTVEIRTAGGEASSSLSVVAISRYASPLLSPTDTQETERFDALRTLVKPMRGADVIVFPENAVYLRTIMQTQDTVALRELEATGNGKSPLIIDSEDVRQDNGALFSQLSYFGSDSGDVLSYKQFLLPLGEYFPYVYRVGVAALGGEGLLEKVLNVRGYAEGPYATIAYRNGIGLAARFCDEVMSPELYRAQVREGANVLINLSSQSWFHGSHLVYEEMKQIARVRAVSLGRWYVQSGNMAPAFVLDQYGQLVAETQWDEMTTIQVRVPSLNFTTPAAWMGQLVLLVPLALIFFFATRREARPHFRSKA